MPAAPGHHDLGQDRDGDLVRRDGAEIEAGLTGLEKGKIEGE